METQSSSSRVVIFGGSGFLGMSLAGYLCSRGYEVVVVSRSAPERRLTPEGCRYVYWDARTLGSWVESVDGACAVVNLAGRTVDCVKTPHNCDQILRSRVEATQVIGEAVQITSDRPRVWVQMSTAHRYGDSELECNELSPFGYGLAPVVGAAWEEAYEQSCPKDVRGVVLRTSFVLGKEAPAWKKLRLITKLGLGGTLSTGTQGMSWVHEDDMNQIFLSAIEDQEMDGPYIASSPAPVSNRDFMKSMRNALNMPIGLPATGWMIQIGARLILQTDPELALYGRYVVPQRLLDEGFEFKYADLDAALANLSES
ncbi:MAG: epimerase [Phycisphaerales bacterium]